MPRHPSNTHARIRIRPKPTASLPRRRIPRRKLGHRNLVRRRNRRARIARLHKVELFAILRHARLDRRRSRDVVGRRRRVTDHGGADPDVGPQAGTVEAQVLVPRGELSEGDAFLCDDGVAGLAGGDVVEFVAVGYHARLDGGGLGLKAGVSGRKSKR